MRPEPDQLQRALVRLAVNQNEIWPNVAISELEPLSDEGMIAISLR